MDHLTISPKGEIHLPDTIRERYGFQPETPIRLIETRNGVLLVPLTDADLSESLRAELAGWQSLGAESWDAFPFDEIVP